MPPETMTLAGHTSEAVAIVCQHSSDPAGSSRTNQTPSSDSPTSTTASSVWSEEVPVPSQPKGSSSVAPPTRSPAFLHPVVHSHVPHCKQHFNWDCGLACVQMILQASGFSQCNYRVLRQFCATTSIWTVDLAHLLRRFGLSVSFFTVTLGPNPAYANESFYMENMEDDERRVSQLFVDAARAGIAVQQKSVSSEELQSWMLSGSCLIIVLVDKRKLDPWLMAADMCLPALCGMELGYTGHYVLLVGYEPATQEFVVRDPAAQEANLRVSAAALDVARRSFGTDEDILVVSGGGGCGGQVGRWSPVRTPVAVQVVGGGAPGACGSVGGRPLERAVGIGRVDQGPVGVGPAVGAGVADAG